ncbi:MAG: ParB/RepB/Spo0J family partition protein [Chitinivibrionales bacterium]|nr:ParB/RepB/Spo0J family partition protein [Chitinivibrionales bacterium]
MVKKKSRRALGRGLTNLIPVDSEERGSDNEIVYVEGSAIETNPFQPRTEFDDKEIEGLSESIQNQGLIQPLVLRKKARSYQIISGERRFRALKLLGKDKIPAIIKAGVSDRDMLEMALVENIQREELNEMEKAVAYHKLMLECGLSHELLSERVGKSRSAITNCLRLLNLPEHIQLLVRKGAISGGHARALLSISNTKEQVAIADKISSDNLSVREIERLSREHKAGKTTQRPAGQTRNDALDPNLQNQIDKLQYHFGTAVAIKSNASHKGKIEIRFLDTDDLNRILELLLS